MRSVMVNRAEDTGLEKRTYLPPSVIRMLPERLVSELYAGHLPEHREEIRLHAGRCAGVVAGGRNILLRTVLSAQEMTATLTRMCGGSLYSHAPTIAPRSSAASYTLGFIWVSLGSTLSTTYGVQNVMCARITVT